MAEDLYSRFAPVIGPPSRYRREGVVATLEGTCADIGDPRSIRVDQGSVFVSRDLDLLAYTLAVMLEFSRPGKPTESAVIEAFTGCLPAGPKLALVPFFQRHLAETGRLGRRKYDEVTSHGAIEDKTPITLLDGGVSPAGSPNKTVEVLALSRGTLKRRANAGEI